ncbi:hypothetical protein P2318_22240 [Myxococcaceae bacterium GXIMD 01537]
MPRSYSFDHFQAPTAEPGSRAQRRKAKQHLASARQEAQEPGAQGVHYGRSHAETEALFQAHTRERRRTTKGAVPKGGRAKGPGASPRPGTAPIGALPRLEEQPPRGRMQDLLEEASRQLQVLQAGMGDVSRAVSRLASLPIEVVRLAARRLRLVHG